MEVSNSCNPFILNNIKSEIFVFKKEATAVLVDVYSVFSSCLQKGIFDEQGSGIQQNLRGKEKLKAIRSILTQRGYPKLENGRVCLHSSSKLQECSQLAVSSSSSVEASSHLFPSHVSKEQMDEEIYRACNQAIDSLKCQIVSVDDQLSISLICPITCSLFEDPVIDNHGHTFEKSAIEAHLLRSRLSPLNRLEITTLKSNRAIKDFVDEMRKNPPIPTLLIMRGQTASEDKVKVQRFIETSATFKSDGDYQTAIEMLGKAFAFTNSSEDYAHLPLLYEVNKQPLQAALAYLYLGKRQLEEEQIDAAVNSIEKALVCAPQEEKILAMQAALFLKRENYLRAYEVFFDLAQRKDQTRDSTRLEGLRYLRQAFFANPRSEDLYRKIVEYTNEEERVYAYLFGYIQLHKYSCKEAEDYYQQAVDLNPKSMIPYLVRLEFVEQGSEEELLLFRTLREIFKEEDSPNWKHFLKLAAGFQRDEDLQLLVDFLIQADKKKPATELYRKWIDLRYPEGKPLIDQAIARIGRKPIFLEQLLKRYLLTGHQDLPSLIFELGTHYEYQEKFDEAQRIYALADSRFNDFEIGFKLASIISRNRLSDGVHRFYTLSIQAQSEHNYDRILKCLQEIKKLDRFGCTLAPMERESYSTMVFAATLFEELQRQQTLNTYLSERVSSLEMMLEQRLLMMEDKVENVHAGMTEVTSLTTELQSSSSSCSYLDGVPDIGFGKAKWGEYYGDVGVERPLPPGTHQLLESQCLIWPDQKVKDTHRLIYFPSSVEGESLSMKYIEELAQNPDKGRNTLILKGFDYSRWIPRRGYWGLVTRWPIPGSSERITLKYSSSRAFDSQECAGIRLVPTNLICDIGSLLSRYNQHLPSDTIYEIPKLFEIAVASMLEFVEYRQFLSPVGSRIYCQKEQERQDLAAIQFYKGGLKQVTIHSQKEAGAGIIGFRKLE